MLDVTTREARKTFYNSAAWLHVKARAMARDHYECVWCREEGRVTTSSRATLEVDHIKELEHYPSLALDITNLRTLCHECHNKRHNRSRANKFDDEIFTF
ncbi:MAG: HNH endonuclease [Streptococcaceae bacterium]|jgi:5-methylcytosine-specific restriction endonuclease McrA|nr:HNH endonuclease [Streptococcaceae bacterium]